MTWLHLSASLVERLGWVLVHSVWQFALVALAALLLQRATQRAASATRCWILLLALGTMLVAPAATWLALPHEGLEGKLPAASNEAPGPGRVEVTTAPLPQPKPAVLALPAAATYSFAAWWPWVRQGLRPWLNGLVIAWCGGVILFAVRPLLGWYRAQRLRTVGVSAAPDALGKVLERAAERLRVRQAVRVLQSTLVQSAVVVGYFRPVILMPVSVVTGFSTAQLEAILAHELAHVRRHDYLVNLLQTLVETAFFYHPAVWWLSSQVRAKRENCCDDLAVAVLGNPVEYGRALLALEEHRGAQTGLVLGVRGGSLLARVRRLLGHVPPGHPPGGGSVAGLGLLAAATLALVLWSASGPVESSANSATRQDLRAGEADDWVLLFNGKDLAGWFVEGDDPGTWRVERGELLVDSHSLPARGRGMHAATNPRRCNFLLTEKTYSEFLLRFEYQLSQGANSGVAFWATPYEKVYREGPIHPQVKLLDDPSYPHVGWPTGTLFWNLDGGGHLLPPDRPARLEAVGSWNRVEVEARARSLRVAVNGVEVLRARPDRLAGEQGAFAGFKRCSGHLGFEKGGGVARFRSIAVKELKQATGRQAEKQR